MNNISFQNLKVVAKETRNIDCSATIVETAMLAINGFAMIQFIEGCNLRCKQIDVMLTSEVELLIKLIKTFQNRDEDHLIEVTYNEIVYLRQWIEVRMAHCEKERDQRIPSSHDPNILKFNPDTYIGMKFLLLDLRELLLGQILY